MKSEPDRSKKNGSRYWVITILASIALFGLAEVASRLFGRVATGQWPTTKASAFYQQLTSTTDLYQAHPYLNTAPRSGVEVRVAGKSASFNSLGYRSPERPLLKPEGTLRVVTIGGSTTFDLLAANNQASWPWLLESRLHSTERSVEVWNAGFPGWTSLESTISLVVKDLQLQPDVIVIFQGINDLQPASAVPFDAQYVGGHAQVARMAAGLSLPKLPWYERLVSLEAVRSWVQEPRDPWSMVLSEADGPGPVARIPTAAVETFGRNLQSQIALARAHRARVLIVSQVARLRTDQSDFDRRYLAGWIRGLEPEAALVELERLNRESRRRATELAAEFLDLSVGTGWGDEHFGDPMHFSAAGSRLFVERLAPEVESLLADASGGEPGSGPS